MGLIVSLVVGAIGGWIASFFVNIPGRGLIGNIVAGVVGGLIVGYLYQALTNNPNPGMNFDLGSILAAAVGAILISLVYSWFMKRSA